jgi:nucleoside recognition membrane protein YjiH
LTSKSKTGFLKFLLPSLVGVLVFITPVRDDGVFTIPMAVMSNRLNDFLGSTLPAIVVLIVSISAGVSLWFSTRNASDFQGSARLKQIFAVNRGWLALRVLGCVIALLIYFKTGPEFIWSDNTGHVVLYDLATAIVTIFIFASFFLPLLTEYGLMELVGTLLSRTFQKAFLLPGRSCIDALASWMVAAPVGVLITSQQYDNGNYSGREAAVIVTNFSVVSLPFCVLVAQFSGMAQWFGQYYLTVVVAGLVAALIMPRIPPLSRIPDTYSPAGRQLFERVDTEAGLLRTAWSAALKKAEAAPGFRQSLRTAMHNLFDVWFGLMPPLIAIGTLGAVIAEYTPVFQFLSYPFVPVLELFKIPEATAVAPALLVGITDMFLPAVLATGIDSELSRFVVITVSITQLVYMTEVGILVLKTAIPLNFSKLMQVFLLRTVITLPIAIAAGHWFIP